MNWMEGIAISLKMTVDWEKTVAFKERCEQAYGDGVDCTQ